MFSTSDPISVKKYRAIIPIITAAESVIRVKNIATHLPFSISCSLFIDMKRTNICGEPKKANPIHK